MDTNPYETGSCTPVPSIAPQRRCVIGLLLFSNRLDWWVRTRGVSALGRFPDRVPVHVHARQVPRSAACKRLSRPWLAPVSVHIGYELHRRRSLETHSIADVRPIDARWDRSIGR